MSDRPLVSVITPTYGRPEELLGAIANVRAQRYRPLEHVIISDGQDLDLATKMDFDDQESILTGRWKSDDDVPIHFVELGRNWSSFLPDSFCAAPTVVGQLVASGAYQTWLSDDERMAPEHIETLVNALEVADADFAYGRVRMWRASDPTGPRWEIGAAPPRLGEITNCLYRAELLRRGLYPFGCGMTSDWACIERWLSSGASYAYVDDVTLTHRVDH